MARQKQISIPTQRLKVFYLICAYAVVRMEQILRYVIMCIFMGKLPEVNTLDNTHLYSLYGINLFALRTHIYVKLSIL